jgi:hypothetical protein
LPVNPFARGIAAAHRVGGGLVEELDRIVGIDIVGCAGAYGRAHRLDGPAHERERQVLHRLDSEAGSLQCRRVGRGRCRVERGDAADDRQRRPGRLEPVEADGRLAGGQAPQRCRARHECGERG